MWNFDFANHCQKACALNLKLGIDSDYTSVFELVWSRHVSNGKWYQLNITLNVSKHGIVFKKSLTLLLINYLSQGFEELSNENTCVLITKGQKESITTTASSFASMKAVFFQDKKPPIIAVFYLGLKPHCPLNYF